MSSLTAGKHAGSGAASNQPAVAEPKPFGSEHYSKEELVAEMGAAMRCGVAGIDS